MRSRLESVGCGAAACCRGVFAVALGCGAACIERTDAPLGDYAYEPCAIDTAAPSLPPLVDDGCAELITREERAFTPHPRAFVEALVLAAEPDRIAVEHARYERAACEMERMQALVPALTGRVEHAREDIGNELEVRFTDGDPFASLGERRCLQSALDGTSELTPLQSSAIVTFSGLYNLASIAERYAAIDGVKDVTIVPRHFHPEVGFAGGVDDTLASLGSDQQSPPRRIEATLSFHGDVMRWEFRTEEGTGTRARVFESDPDGTIRYVSNEWLEVSVFEAR